MTLKGAFEILFFFAVVLPVSSLVGFLSSSDEERVDAALGREDQVVGTLNVLPVLHPEHVRSWLPRNRAFELEGLADAYHDCFQLFCYLRSSRRAC